MDLFTLADQTARSFALTLRMLPLEVREEICLGYLLARASDTVADSAAAAVGLRVQVLHQLAQAAATGTIEESLTDRLNRLADILTHAGEAGLLRATPGLLAHMKLLDEDAAARVNGVLATIFSGQLLDLERFCGEILDGTIGHPVRHLPDRASLLDYTWRVAGCVGEFWTDVLAARLPESLLISPRQMRDFGRAYGQGLQLINILRDAPADWRAGRCYLPGVVVSAAEVTTVPTELFQAMRTWLPQCADWLAAGESYGMSLSGLRIRTASRLPLELAEKTLRQLEAASQADWEARIKVPRSAVRKSIAKVFLRSLWH